MNPSADSGSDTDDGKENEELPKGRLIEILPIPEASPPGSSSATNHVLIKSIETDLESRITPSGTLYVYKHFSKQFCSIFKQAERRLSSPWKGMSSYKTARPLLQPTPQCVDPLILLLTKLSDHPSLLHSTGIFLLYQALPNKRIRVDFYLHQNRVLGSIFEYNYQRKLLNREQQYLIKLIIMGNAKEIAKEDAENSRHRRRADLDFGAFFELYDDLRGKFVQTVPDYKLNEESINFSLMPYQKDTVRWMMHREADETVDTNLSWMYECDYLPSGSSCYYYPHSLPVDSSCFYYPHLGILTRKKLDQQEALDFAKSNTLKGGILSDEMGLGKTVQVLALISSHQRNDAMKIEQIKPNPIDDDDEDKEEKEGLTNYSITEQVRIAERSFKEMKNARNSVQVARYNVEQFVEGETIICSECEQMCSAPVCGWDLKNWKEKKFVCPNCVTKNGSRKEVKTTLIIVPESLIFQWFTEIAKHCSDGIKVLFYFGVKKHGYLHPDKMNEYDVVLTTYDTIRAELNFSDVKELRTDLRREITSLFLVSSLVHVHFWRVIVDESQVIPQNVTSKLSTMFSNIQGKNWWCVTGTPLVKTIADIFTLFSFLKLKPFGYPAFYTQYMHSEYLDIFSDGNSKDVSHVKLLQLVTEIMSRKTKKIVEEQMKLPELTEIEKKICFTAVEERQYKDEKERLSEIVEQNLQLANDSQHLADLKCRDKVLHDLRSLQETVLTGQTNSSSLAAPSNFMYAPETVIFRLIQDKKTSLVNNLREFIMNALGLSGVQLLLKKKASALSVYKHAFTKYEEFLKNAGLEELKGRESIKRLLDSISQDNLLLTEEEENGEDDELSRIDKNNEEMYRLQTMAGIIRKVKQVCKKYAQNSADAEEDIEMEGVVKQEEVVELNLPKPQKTKRPADDIELENRDDLPGPSEPKRPCLNDHDEVKTEDCSKPSENQEIVAEQSSSNEQLTEEEEERRQKVKMRKLVRKAVEPIKMDWTQEAHLLFNLHRLQFTINPAEQAFVPMERFEKLCDRFQKIEKDSLICVRDDLQELTKIWSVGDENFIDVIENFFHSLRWDDVDDLTSLYDKDFKLNQIVKRDHVPNLPFIAMYNTSKKLAPKKTSTRAQDLTKHNTRRCMGRCEDAWTFDPYAGEKCLKVSAISDLTMGQIEFIETKIKDVGEQMERLIQFVLKMTDPLTLLDFLVLKKEESSAEREQMKELIDCEHPLIKGTWLHREGVDKYYNEQHKCKLCDAWCKLSLLSFHAGFASFHGWPKQKSSVFEFASYLVNNFAPEKSAQEFIKKYLRPFFERIDDFIKVLTQTAMIIVELTDRFDELRTSQTVMTDSQLEKFGEEKVEVVRARASEHHLRQRNKAFHSIEKEVKDLRYLINLMEQQLTGEKDELDECPVCNLDLDAFMIFTCGHRVCPDCFTRIKEVAAADALRRDIIRTSSDRVKCPTCRIVNTSRQVMLACRVATAEESIIPGVVLSAKLNCAIQLLRDILREDSLNKIIVFTTFDPMNNSSVWQYLVKILTLAKLPFAAASRSNCGKKVLDFEASTETKVLLCSLSMCANGLNMTGANHIIFLDPPHLQSVLHQAIGRINRIGQRRAMTVHHLIVEGSLDSELREIAKTSRGSDERKGWTVGDIRGMFDIETPRFLAH